MICQKCRIFVVKILRMKTKRPTREFLKGMDQFQLIQAARDGIEFDIFDQIRDQIPLGLSDWSRLLNVSDRTMQRYKRERKRFDPLHSDRLLAILILFNNGSDVFGDLDKFMSWINTVNMSMGGIRPIDVLDNSIGIAMVKDELTRIEHGILA